MGEEPDSRKPAVFLHGVITTPPFSREARREAGTLLRYIQEGISVEMPHSRPMPTIGPRCHELRINDKSHTWRIVYRIDVDRLLIVEVFSKKTQQTPDNVINTCRQRLKLYDKGRQALKKKKRDSHGP
jgi:phage-related protein